MFPNDLRKIGIGWVVSDNQGHSCHLFGFGGYLIDKVIPVGIGCLVYGIV